MVRAAREGDVNTLPSLKQEATVHPSLQINRVKSQPVCPSGGKRFAIGDEASVPTTATCGPGRRRSVRGSGDEFIKASGVHLGGTINW